MKDISEDYCSDVIDGKTYFFIKEVIENPSHFIRAEKSNWLKEARRIRKFKKFRGLK